MRQVWVTELEDGEMGEDEAVMAVADAMCCGSVEIRLAAGGRANLMATENCCALVDDELLKQINCTSSVVIATVSELSLCSRRRTSRYHQERAFRGGQVAARSHSLDFE